jgi:uncharacterized protein (DUF1330 family)
MGMKANIKIAAAASGGLVLGACLSGGIGIAPDVLHAQGTAPYYEVAEVNVKDQAGYEKSGVDKVRDAIKANGGKVIAGGYNKAQSLIGAPAPNRFLIFVFPTKEAHDKVWAERVKAWIDREGMKYADFRAAASKASNRNSSCPRELLALDLNRSHRAGSRAFFRELRCDAASIITPASPT